MELTGCQGDYVRVVFTLLGGYFEGKNTTPSKWLLLLTFFGIFDNSTLFGTNINTIRSLFRNIWQTTVNKNRKMQKQQTYKPKSATKHIFKKNASQSYKLKNCVCDVTNVQGNLIVLECTLSLHGFTLQPDLIFLVFTEHFTRFQLPTY